MSKASKSTTSPSLRPAPDAVSLHSQTSSSFHSQTPPYLDDDAPELEVDDLPPLYADVAADSSDSAPLLTPSRPDGDGQQQQPAANLIPHHVRDANTGAAYYLDRRLNEDPGLLQSHVEAWAATPPRPYVRVRGTHQQTVDKNGKKERSSVTDFDIHIELTPYLYSDATHRKSWRELRTVDNGDKTRRGTVFRRRAPGAKQNIEVGGDTKPTLQEWCHMYCASHGGLKVFALKRKMVGFDEQAVRTRIETLVRSTNYRGHLNVTFPVKNATVEVYNDCRTNRWRLTTWIQWVFMLTLMFIFTWPYLFFRTKRFEVVVAEWPFSRPAVDGGKQYVSISEQQWYNMWGRALGRAVLGRRQGTLGQDDLVAAEGAEPNFDTGHATVDGALSFVRAGVNAMNEVNRQLGWGGDC